MKTPKTSYPLIAATVIIAGVIIPSSFGGEKPTVQNALILSQTQADAVSKLVEANVVQPLNHQAKLRSSFSRKRSTHSTSYHLVETTTKGSQSARTFTVMQKVVPLHVKSKSGEAKSSHYLKLRHLADGDQIQVDLKDQWVALSEHPILKFLPKPKPANTITP